MGIKTQKESALKSRKIEFRLERPNTQEVFLVGEFNGWDINDSKSERRAWKEDQTNDAS